MFCANKITEVFSKVEDLCKELSWFGKHLLFLRFKLHIFTNNKSGIIDCMVTAENVDDRNPLQCKNFAKKLYEKLF
ncbi:Transposase DDE domain-containing protein [Chryseobacterium sp. RU37D]|uniref:transposase n=1 Tax=Chryseobacterium sp. RU37D TaxID=1907397 RepID=UPI0009560454|nr:transposase [Chryseobacterium sp. RU37D]SIQ36737.1 Transposase DDE domain-containing protein [Chryseobacterium sp. RU37D]